jgi:hypothetical protein
MVGLFDYIFAPTARDNTLGGLLGTDPAALRSAAISKGLWNAGAALLQAGGPSRAPVGWGQGVGGAMTGFSGGYDAGYDHALRHGLTTAQLARYKRQGEREAELDRLRQAAIIEAQTGGGKVPTRTAAANMRGIWPTEPTAPATMPVSYPPQGLGLGDVNNPLAPSPLLNAAIDRATGFAPRVTGAGGPAPMPARYPVSAHVAPESSKNPSRQLDAGAGYQQAGGTPQPGQSGLPPAMAAYLLHSAPGTFAQIAATNNRPMVLNRGDRAFDRRTGQLVAEGGRSAPRMTRIVDGDRVYNALVDPESGDVTPLGDGGPRFSPRGRSELTATQLKNNDKIDLNRALVVENGWDTPEARQNVTTEFLPNGRTNPAYQRGAARIINSALERKTGADDDYEDFSRRLNARPAGKSGPGARPAVEAVAVPTLPSGGVDASKLKHGQVYEAGDGARFRWDSMRKGFAPVD